MINNGFDRKLLIELITSSLNEVHDKDLKLFTLNVGENCLNHRLGLYLTKHFEKGDVTVDLEYNRHLDETKTYAKDRRAIVDIAIHKRDSDARNICAIECKKVRASEKDKEKIKSFISSKFNYQFGAIVVYNKRLLSLSWIENGKTKSLDINY